MLFFISLVDLAKCEPDSDGTPGGPGFVGCVVTRRDASDEIAEASEYAADLALKAAGMPLDTHLEAVLYILPDDAIGQEYLDRVLNAEEAMSIPEPE